MPWNKRPNNPVDNGKEIILKVTKIRPHCIIQVNIEFRAFSKHLRIRHNETMDR